MKSLEDRWGQELLGRRGRVTAIDIANINTTPLMIYDLWKPLLNRNACNFAAVLSDENGKLMGIFGATLVDRSDGEPYYRVYLVPTMPLR